jgi:hypothetical protein
MFENRALRKIFALKGEEVTGDWRQVDNEGLHDLHCSPNIIKVIISKTMWWSGEHVTNIVRREMHTEFWSGNDKERFNVGVLCLDGRMILNCILQK